MDEIKSTFVNQRYQDCKGCHVQWNIYSIELEEAFAKHEKKCLLKNKKS